ncbi:NAD-dependent epimerase/dehydratase family protein [Bacteroides cellulosilyticus]|uniref:NAD-dependent epimerase/dehydratase family protein n=1 Tax=Bacteroides cellulosilyticus TaxID=246787 RepID=UPI0018ACABFE|nr:NAD(P)-dependent oxidoreductase [Bacteroides cellulosilyticus]
MKKDLISGGSGFIGTNLIEFLDRKNIVQLLSIDKKEPKINRHRSFWKQVDLCDKDTLKKTILDFQPNYVIHLAARTDLCGKELIDYDANMLGVSNLLDVLDLIPNLQRAIFASSMYVCTPGYIPKSFEDYAPHTLYGESKVETEKRIKEKNPKYTWSIIRPTSIWGPWFGEPYDKFFRIVLNRMYFHMGKRACRKTYGYIDNVIYQILSILKAPEEKIMGKVFYLGDYEAYDITEWANEIAICIGHKIPRIPYFLFVLAGWLGDFLKMFGIAFPMTSFRLRNMTTDNVHNLEPIREIAPELPTSRQEGNKKTIEWINSQK